MSASLVGSEMCIRDRFNEARVVPSETRARSQELSGLQRCKASVSGWRVPESCSCWCGLGYVLEESTRAVHSCVCFEHSVARHVER
eukprot:12952464-Alexandrium_andersonii.AAC.1